MATVFLALVAGPGGFKKLMVVKILRDDLMGGSEDAVNMFWSEAKLSAQLVHANIVHTFEVGEIEGRYFMAMEYLDGQTLRTVQIRSASQGGLPLNESLRILAEAARGLHYSHGLKSFKGEPLGVVHRDVSPQNLMLTYDGQVKVLDFGIAKMRNSEHLTQAGMIKGKLEYVAPEQLKSTDHLDGRADVFALGAMLWEAVTGERFAGGNKVADVAKVHARLSGGERKVRELKPDVPEALAQIVDKAIAIDVNERFPSAAHFAAAIDAYLAQQPVRPTAESLASFLEPIFATERARIQQLVDEQIERSESGMEPIPQLAADPLSISASGVIANSAPRAYGNDTVVDIDAPAPPPAPKRGKGLWIAAGVLLAAGSVFALQASKPPQTPVAAGVVGTASTSSAPDTQGATTAATATADPLRSVSENAPQSVMLEVKVKPASASVTLDGAALTVPFHGRFQKSDSFHIIEAHADGFRPFKRLVPFNVDQNIIIELESAPQPVARRPQRSGTDRARAEVTPAAEPAAPVVTPPAPKEPEAIEPGKRMNGPGTSMRRRLMVDDPYATQK